MTLFMIELSGKEREEKGREPHKVSNRGEDGETEKTYKKRG
jgi:hypothetical protein